MDWQSGQLQKQQNSEIPVNLFDMLHFGMTLMIKNVLPMDVFSSFDFCFDDPVFNAW